MVAKKAPVKKAPAKSSKGKGKMPPQFGAMGGGGKSCPSCGAPMFGRGTKCYGCGTKK